MAERIRPGYAVPTGTRIATAASTPSEDATLVTIGDQPVEVTDPAVSDALNLLSLAITALADLGLSVTFPASMAVTGNFLTDVQLRSADVNTKVTNLPFGQKVTGISMPVTMATDQPDINVLTLNSLVPARYDYVDLNYTGADLTQVLFKAGGSGGTLVRTLTLTYSGGVLDTVTAT